MNIERNKRIVEIVEKASEIEKGFMELIREDKIDIISGDKYNAMLFELNDMYREFVIEYGILEGLTSVVAGAAEINDYYLELINKAEKEGVIA